MIGLSHQVKKRKFMLTETIGSDNEFLSSFSTNLDGDPESLKKARLKFWDRFLELGLPYVRKEDYQYLHLKPLFLSKYQKAKNPQVTADILKKMVLPECQEGFIVFANGYFRKDLSNLKGVLASCDILPFAEAARTFGTLLNNSNSKLLKEEKDAFALLNTASYQEGIFFYLPPNVCIDKPIQIINIVNPEKEYEWMMPRLYFFIGSHAKCSIVTTCHFNGVEKCLYNSFSECMLEDGAQMSFLQYDLDAPNIDSWIFEALRVTLKRNSHFQSLSLADSRRSRRDFRVALAGEGSEALLNGLWILDEEKEAHTHVLIEHIEPHCHSDQLFKGVLAGSAHSSFQGKILVQKKAQKTTAYQLNNNLILSDKAQANSKPNLEIFADDVKASHGATSGQLDRELLFYLKTRGFSDFDAKNCLINGFCQELIDKIQLNSLKERSSQYIHSFTGPT